MSILCSSTNLFSFFEHIDRVIHPKFAPVDQDILRARLRTTGIVENTFLIENVDFRYLFSLRTI